MRWITLLLATLSFNVLGDTKKVPLFDCDKVKGEKMCIACNIYHEARGEVKVGQSGSTNVVMNRIDAKGFPDTACGVILEKRWSNKFNRWVPMFSWTRDGKSDKVYNKESWKYALKLAEQFMSDNPPFDVTFGALWYHNDSVSPYWKDHYYHTVKIGSHHYYVKTEEVFLANITKLAGIVE